MNWFTRFFMVLLRMAIGWHCLYEGVTKLDSHWYNVAEPKRTADKKVFSAEVYLRNASGPLREHFRGIVDDFDGYKALDAAVVTAKWQVDLQRASQHYNFTKDQQEALEKTYQEKKAKLEAYLSSKTMQDKIAAYKKDREAWKAADKTLGSMNDLYRSQHWEKFTKLEGTRRELTGPVNAWGEELHDALILQLTDEQFARGEAKPAWGEMTELQRVNLINAYGLTAAALGMLLGLFSRLSSLAAAGFLALFYISMPPWPGLPVSPKSEGNYVVVNKNLVEMIACLMLATSPSGVWGGLDALIRGFITRPLFKVGAEEIRQQDAI